ncbi:MAG: helix-hairpin-helix domain-containing protein [Senegalia sp. (in: firmicutes)]|uniref:helix-hairpin-helix domain-containing protein n=1 Tax=Senegalia sp. (in: firmicutes) TaxID=1924098 RepID=UPI003F968D62
MPSFTKKEQIVILILVILVIGVIGFNLLMDREEDIVYEASTNLDNSNLENEIETKEEDLQVDLADIVIHISGAVNNPGIFTLEAESRVNDAVEIAGGLTQEADINKVNLAKKIVDEEKIHIYKIGEEEIINNESDQNTQTHEGNPADDSSKININTADNASLESLPGIGKVKANNIIEYRAKTKFIKIEDIMNVDGIGEKTFENIKNKLTI